MSSQTTFEKQVLRGVEFTLPPPTPPARKICPHAKAFHEWCVALLKETRANPTDITVNLAELYLQEHFFAWIEAAPSACRKHFRLHHANVRCFMEIYREHYFKLFDLQRKLVVPRLREPSSPASVAQTFAGVTLGEVIDAAL